AAERIVGGWRRGCRWRADEDHVSVAQAARDLRRLAVASAGRYLPHLRAGRRLTPPSRPAPTEALLDCALWKDESIFGPRCLDGQSCGHAGRGDCRPRLD